MIQKNLSEDNSFNDFSELEKVNFLLQGIKVSEVDVAIATIQASRTLMEDFSQACVIISDFLRVRVGCGTGKNRSIAAVNTHKSGGGGGRGNGGGGGA